MPALVRALVLVAVGAALGAVVGLVRHGGVAVPVAEQVEACEAPDLDVPVPRVHAHDAAEYCATRTAAVLDVRPAERFAAGHIADAIHLPCSAPVVEAATDAALSAADFILVYGDSAAEAEPVAREMVERYGQRVQVLDGGYAAWESEGRACVSGPSPRCRERAL